MLDIVASCHCMQFQGKLTNQTRGNGKKPSFRPDFGPFGPNVGGQFFFFFFKNLASIVTRYHGRLSSCTISEKTNDLILRRLSNGRTDGRTDRRTDGRTVRRTDGPTDVSDLVGHGTTNVERPKSKSYFKGALP